MEETLQIGFIGLGLFGGSVAKSIKRFHPEYKIFAYTRTEATLDRAISDGIVDVKCTKEDSAFENMQHGPIAIDDLVGDLLIEEQGFTKEQSDATKYILNSIAKMGLTNIPKAALLQAGKLIVKYHMTVPQVTELYKRYIGNWGESATQYRFDAIVGDEVVKTITKAPMKQSVLKVKADHTELVEKHTYDVALVQIRMVSEHENVLAFSHEPIHLETEGPIEIIGPKYIALQGGMSGTYVKTTGKSGLAKLFVRDTQGHEEVISFMVKQGEN